MEDEDGNFEIEVRDGCELRYHKGQLGNYVGVTERVGKGGKKSYQARLSITKHKGDKRRQYPLGTFKSAVKAAIAIAEATGSIHTARPPLRAKGSLAHVCSPQPATCLDLFYYDACFSLVALASHVWQQSQCSSGSASTIPRSWRIIHLSCWCSRRQCRHTRLRRRFGSRAICGQIGCSR